MRQFCVRWRKKGERERVYLFIYERERMSGKESV